VRVLVRAEQMNNGGGGGEKSKTSLTFSPSPTSLCFSLLLVSARSDERINTFFSV
jgi:hypothetical protein